MQDIDAQNLSVLFRHAGIALRSEVGRSAFRIIGFLLGEGGAFFDDFVPDPEHGVEICRGIGSDSHINASKLSNRFIPLGVPPAGARP